MKFAIFLIFLVAFGAILVSRNALRARTRLKLLQTARRVMTFDEIQQEASKPVKIVQTNFGYGREVWALTIEKDPIDLKLRAFKTATLVLPRPKHADLEKFCESQGIALVVMMAKYQFSKSQ